MKIGIFGAGAIGTFIGLKLAKSGPAVTMLGRPKFVETASRLVATDTHGRRYRPGSDTVATADPADLADVDLCLLTVKSRDTESAADTMAEVLPPAVPIISFQNGLRNPERLSRRLPNPVLAGMVGFNVLWTGPEAIEQATDSPLMVEQRTDSGSTGPILERFELACRKARLPLELRKDLHDIMAGKLLLNLNNGVCAVTGATISESLRSRPSRQAFAMLIREGDDVLRKAGKKPASVVGISPRWIARLLSMPNALVLAVARKLVAINPRAKSSTLQDLERGKPTEIDDLAGEIVRIAAQHGLAAPKNRVVVDAVHELEKQDSPRFWTARELRNRLRKAG